MTSTTIPRPPTPSVSTDRDKIGQLLQRNPFSGLIHSAGELLHTPYRISTSMTTALLSQWINTFYVYSEQLFSSFLDWKVHPSSPDLLTKHGPLENQIIIWFQLIQSSYIFIQSLKIGRGYSHPRNLSSFTLPKITNKFSAILRETSEGTSY